VGANVARIGPFAKGLFPRVFKPLPLPQSHFWNAGGCGRDLESSVLPNRHNHWQPDTS